MTAKELVIAVEKELWADADAALAYAETTDPQHGDAEQAWSIADAARNRASASTRVVLAKS